MSTSTDISVLIVSSLPRFNNSDNQFEMLCGRRSLTQSYLLGDTSTA